jgi:CheY-like chemotaxis protein
LLVVRLQRAARVAGEPDVPKALTGVHVLVVDGDQDARALLESVLTYCGAFVATMATAADAADYLRTGTSDVVVVDVTLPGEDGYRLVREIGARASVLALTTESGDGPERTLAAGFHAHMRKPVDPWELCRVIAELARKP